MSQEMPRVASEMGSGGAGQSLKKPEMLLLASALESRAW